MEQEKDDAGLEFVLDGRKLIVGFVLLMALCGTFFVLGYMEGKRQVLRVERDGRDEAPAGASLPSALPEGSTGGKQEPAGQEAPAVKAQLDWYKNVNQGPGDKTSKPRAAKDDPYQAGDRKETPPQAPPPAAAGAQEAANSSPAAATVYSVQVGAFREKKEAERKAAMLAEKGYDYAIDAPKPGQEYYLLKVGRFATRADAVAMQLKLKQDGFATLIKIQ